jgi:hypothetical protein
LVNETADHRNAYLIIENAKIEEEDLLKMKSIGIIFKFSKVVQSNG